MIKQVTMFINFLNSFFKPGGTSASCPELTALQGEAQHVRQSVLALNSP